MTYTSYIVYFLLFSMIGWLLDSCYSSLEKKEFVNSGYFHELPICPMYGFGGVALILAMEYLEGYPMLVAIIISALMLTMIEYVGGIFCITIMKERLWDYRSHKWNIHGHIDALHALYWLLLTIVFYHYFYPTIRYIHVMTWSGRHISPHTDATIFFLFCFAAFIFTAKRRHVRLNRAISASSHATGLRKIKRRYSR